MTEALAAGVPLLLLPLSTEKFAGAAALEAAGLGEALDPDTATPAEVRTVASQLLDLDPDAAARLAQCSEDLTTTPGGRRARAAMVHGDHAATERPQR